MARSINRGLWQQWEERVQRFSSSGLTVAEYCQAEGVSQAAFYNWRKKFRGRSAATTWRTAAAPARAVFVPVLPTAPGATGSFPATVVLTLANGVRVEVPSADPELVGHVVRTAAECRLLTAAGEQQ